MQILEQVNLLVQTLSSIFSPTVDTCQFHTLWSNIPEPLQSLEGQCITASGCTGYRTVGFCRGAADIQVSATLPQKLAEAHEDGPFQNSSGRGEQSIFDTYQ